MADMDSPMMLIHKIVSKGFTSVEHWKLKETVKVGKLCISEQKYLWTRTELL